MKRLIHTLTWLHVRRANLLAVLLCICAASAFAGTRADNYVKPENFTFLTSDTSVNQFSIISALANFRPFTATSIHDGETEDFHSFTTASTQNGRIAFVSRRDGNYEIYVMNADGSNPTRLTNNTTDDDSPMFSPDGTKIVFTSQRDGNAEIYVMNANGTNQIRLTNNSAYDTSPAFSPDGLKIAFESDRTAFAQIYTMNAADGTNQTRITPNSEFNQFPKFSPDGLTIVFASYRSGSGEIYVINVNGTGETRLTNNAVQDGNPAFSPDGTKIVFDTERDGNSEIYTMNANGTSPTRLTTNTAFDYGATFSPDGTKVAFTSQRDGNREVYTMNVNGSSQTRLTASAGDDQQPTWQTLQTSAFKIAFRAARTGGGDIYTMNQDGTAQTNIYPVTGADDQPAISPDGSKILFVKSSDIYSINADGSGSAVQLTTNAAFDGMPAWSPDNSKIVFMTQRDGNSELYTMNANGTSQTRLTNNGLDDRLPHWSPDGTQIVFARTGANGFDIWKMNANGMGMAAQLTNNNGSNAFPRWSPNGTKICFYSNRAGNAEIYVINASGANQTNLTNTAAASEFVCDWSPDGSRIVFESNRGGNYDIYTADASNGGGLMQLTTDTNSDDSPSWQRGTTAPVATYAVSGRVTDGGVSAVNYVVTLTGTDVNGSITATTDSNGNYVFSNLTASGNYNISLDPAVFAAAPTSVTNLQSNQTVNITAGNRILYSVGGTINRSALPPSAPNFQVELRNIDTAQFTTVTSGANGSYNFPSVEAGRSYRITPSPSGGNYTSPINRDISYLNSNRAAENFTAVAAASSYAISGAVNSQMGFPTAVSNLTVTITGTGITNSLTTTTDQNGNYTFPTLTVGGNFNVSVDSSVFMSLPQTVTNLQSNQTVNFTGNRALYQISGTISRNTTPATGAPNVQVQLDKTGTGQFMTATTDQNGNYIFNAEAGYAYRIMPFPSGYASITPVFRDISYLNSMRSGENFVATIQTYVISGRVTDNFGPPATVANLTITLTGTDINGSINTTTDSNGNYTFSGLTAGGNFNITPDPMNQVYSFTPQSVFNLQSAATVDFMGTRRNHTINGRVRYGFSNNFAPLGGVTVAIRNAAGGPLPVATVTTDSNGFYGTLIPAGENYTVTPTFNNFTFTPSVAQVQYLSAPATRDFEVAATGSGISGRVGFSESGNFTPLSNITVNISGASSASIVTDSAGFYSFVGLVGGSSYTISAQDTTIADFSPQTITLQGNQNVDFFGARQTYPVGGVVTNNANNLPVQNANVTLRRISDNAVVGAATTGANGSYTFANVPAGINYGVSSSSTGFSFTPLSVNVPNLSAPLSNINFRGYAPTINYTISGTVQTSDGANVAGAIVNLSGMQSTGTAATDSLGNYSFTVPGSSDYYVSVAKPGINFNPASQTFINLQANQTANFQNGVPLCVPPPSGLISWYRAETNADDALGVNSGAFTGAANYSPGKVGQSFNFNGSNRVQTSTANFPLGNSSRTMEMWVYLNTTEFAENIFAGYGGFGTADGAYILGALPDGRLFFSQGGTSVSSSTPLLIGRWNHVAVTNTGDNVTLYINGVSAASGLLTINTTSGGLNIGQAPNGFESTRKLNGRVDETQIYSRALSASEIQMNYNAGSAGVCQTTAPTPTGANVSVSSNNASLFFGNVTQPGSTAAIPIQPSSTGALPTGYVITTGLSVAYDVVTSAAFVGSVQVSFDVPAVPNSTTCLNLRMLHFNTITNQTENITLVPNQYNGTTCTVRGTTTSFSNILVTPFSAPTAASVSVSGRVTTARGEGIKIAFITLTDSQGNSQTALSGKFGAYRFREIQAGATYVISVQAKRYTFTQSTQVRSISEDLTDVDFVAIEK